MMLDEVKQLVALFQDKGATVTVEWKEPKVVPGEGLIWETFTASGPINNRFIEWAERHYDYWIPRNRSVILRIVSVVCDFRSPSNVSW